MSPLLQHLVVAGAFVFMSFGARAEWLNELYIMSDYISDGVSQTDKDPSIQWKTTYQEANYYALVHFANLSYSLDRGEELDLGFGRTFEWNDTTVDFGVLNNFNLSFNDVDKYFLELYTGFQWRWGGSLYFTLSDDKGSFDGGNNAKFNFDHSLKIDETWSWSYQLGYSDMYRSKLTDSDYLWWGAGVSYQAEKFTTQLIYRDTDIAKLDDPYDVAQAKLVLRVNIVL